jgi:hypothetical protein
MARNGAAESQLTGKGSLAAIPPRLILFNKMRGLRVNLRKNEHSLEGPHPSFSVALVVAPDGCNPISGFVCFSVTNSFATVYSIHDRLRGRIGTPEFGGLAATSIVGPGSGGCG